MKKKILDLVLKYKWFDMIYNGVKQEEYRQYKDRWKKMIGEHLNDYDYVKFHRGYTNNTILCECKGIRQGYGRIEWGAPEDEEVYVIKLGKIIEDNCFPINKFEKINKTVNN